MEYDTFVKSLDELPQGKDVDLYLRDLSPGRYKYIVRHVRGVVSGRATPGGDTLWLRFHTGYRHPQPWSIKITEELD
ncbi:MAG: phenylphosphate carboxylase subunit gamma [Chloroflexi bacterium]|nr:phenylphosphate carboxylase subunit gamma [Chloroflexota bacterium]